MSKCLELLKTRRSTKRWKDQFKLSDEQKITILDAIRFAPSSNGMEPFRVLYIEDMDIRKELNQAFFGQSGVLTASALLIWITPSENWIENKVVPVQVARNIPEQFATLREGKINGLRATWKNHNVSANQWAARQAYISLGTMIVTAAEQGINTCPLEGFIPGDVKEVLVKTGLMDKENEEVSLACFVGKVDESAEMHYAFSKSRKPAEESYKVV
ncbi:nitroreductase family protein [Spiroplasma tabanidicola]|uniref:Nitroreductase n=1 Tax=Spiroplasma tabanidicola TaxID=324079 RepID=A0A6I6C736_9MOLU|nr:nitroreductase family protein [Spiroplasma tabanidicola]QGS51606.1 nitroreductase [Spiroplasma tabanidicola]